MPSAHELDDPGIDLDIDVSFRLGFAAGCASKAGLPALAMALHSLYHLWQLGLTAEANDALRSLLAEQGGALVPK